MSTFSIHTQPALEPITLNEAKAHLHVTYTDEDALIAAIITAARQYVEEHTWRAILTQTWNLFLDQMPGTCNFHLMYPSLALSGGAIIKLPKGQLQTVDFYKYYDTSDVEQTLTPNTDYRVDTYSEPARIQQITTPSVYDKINAINIRFTCGWALTLGSATVATSVAIATGTITYAAHGLVKGDPIQLSALGSITGVSINTTYFVADYTSSTFTIASTVCGSTIIFGGTNDTPPTFKKVTTPLVPAPLKQAMLLQIGHLFAHREDVVVGTIATVLDNSSKYLMSPYRLFRFNP